MLNPHSGQRSGCGGLACADAGIDQTSTPAATAAPRHNRLVLTPGMMVRGLAWDVGLPLMVFYGLHLAGVGDWLALLGATLAGAARMGWVAVRYRTLNSFAVVMLGVFGLGLGLAFVTGEPRFLLLQFSILTSFVGIMFLASAVWGRQPLTLAAVQHWVPSHAVEIVEEYRTDPGVRHAYRFSSTIWGLGLLTDAIARIPLVLLLPSSVVVELSNAMTLAILAGLIVWNIRYERAAARRAGAEASRASH
jgi:hypothetical protein